MVHSSKGKGNRIWHIDICAIVMEHPRTIKREPIYPHISLISFIEHCILNTKILVRLQYGLLNLQI